MHRKAKEDRFQGLCGIQVCLDLGPSTRVAIVAVTRHPVVARRVGRTSRRWIGIVGNSCWTALWSGADWNTEKLQ